MCIDFITIHLFNLYHLKMIYINFLFNMLYKTITKVD